MWYNINKFYSSFLSKLQKCYVDQDDVEPLKIGGK